MAIAGRLVTKAHGTCGVHFDAARLYSGGCMLAIEKPVYGLVSTPEAWFNRLREVIEKHVFSVDLSDDAIIRLQNAAGTVIGVLAIHVVDNIGGDTPDFHQMMDRVAEDDRFHLSSPRILAPRPLPNRFHILSPRILVP
jgi:hypothetical protein